MSKPAATYDELYPGGTLDAECIAAAGGDVTLTVKSLNNEPMPDSRNSGVLRFHKTDRVRPLNVVNGVCLRIMFGPDPQAVIGKRIIFVSEQTRDPRGMAVDGVRVKGSPDMGRGPLQGRTKKDNRFDNVQFTDHGVN